MKLCYYDIKEICAGMNSDEWLHHRWIDRIVPPDPKSRQTFLKKDDIKLVGYTLSNENYVEVPPPLLSYFSDFVPKCLKNTL